MEQLFHVIHEDGELLVVYKPAGLVCHPTKGDVYSSLISRARLHLGDSVQPQLIHRLDRETSGIVLLAKTDTAARLWRRRWESGSVQKIYRAIVHGFLSEDSGVIDAPLGKDEQSVVAIKDTVRPDGAVATTRFCVLRRFEKPEGQFTCVEAELLTGRKHQIRIHLAHHGHPVVGDKIYGGDERIYLDFVEGRLSEEQRQRLLTPYQALHCQRIEFADVPSAQRISFEAEPEDWFREFSGS